ncbi:SH3 domain-containing protein [Ancylobacter sp. SL191]|uniref:SH3 domain-containing protein n=1 Tax=Ancylobacter sp. SL191 TaxID=2995166 RepID=UPI002270CA09|nr:SH3 domain-containing protein [Ancylobacter sp. SL191]WAC28054.1 SH3 domain-containing protein [Ancylobacter sp. SL191]
MKRVLAGAAFLLLALGGSAFAQQRGFVTTDVNLRAGPSTGYPVVVVLEGGTPLGIYGCLDDYSWCDVDWRGARGWIAARYLEYDYGGRRVEFVPYAPTVGVPIVAFSFGDYWGRYYRGRSWYSSYDRWGSPPPRPGYGPPPGPGYRPPPPGGWGGPGYGGPGYGGPGYGGPGYGGPGYGGPGYGGPGYRPPPQGNWNGRPPQGGPPPQGQPPQQRPPQGGPPPQAQPPQQRPPRAQPQPSAPPPQQQQRPPRNPPQGQQPRQQQGGSPCERNPKLSMCDN